MCFSILLNIWGIIITFVEDCTNHKATFRERILFQNNYTLTEMCKNNTKGLCISLTQSFLPLLTSYTTTVQYQMQETDTATNNRPQFVFKGFNALMHYMYNFSILSLYENSCHQQNGKQMRATKKILHNDPNAIIPLKSH